MGKKLKKGKAGNAAQYITRTQAVRKLQLRLSEFRRLCILKGVHPREPKKKPKGANKTYYHVKDINWLAHEPLLNTFRNIKAHDKKVRRARAKHNAELAKQLMHRKPTYRLDHLVKERYPSFVDALRDLDDALTMIHLFATLPAEAKYDIPAKAVQTARRLALEWQAYVVRSGSLRRVFVSVKGYYFQAEVLGQSVTWLVPHALSQVLPTDVDYKVMLTFLEFYNTLLQFVNFKLYHMLGLRYPPLLDPRLEEAAAELAAIMKDIAGLRDAAEGDRAQEAAAVAAGRDGDAGGEGEDAAAAASDPQMRARIESLQSRLREIVGKEEEGEGQEEGKEDKEEEDSEADAEEDSEAPVLDSGGSDSEEEDEEDDDEEEEEKPAAGRPAARSKPLLGDDDEAMEEEDDDDAPAAGPASDAQDAGTRAAGGALGPHVDPSDEAAVCSNLFRGLVFFLGREVPREPLMLVIRAFGGVAAWDGEGSPHEETSEVITHQVVDRPKQGHKFLSREYVQPQWVFDSANFRVLMASDLYAPGQVPPPHLSPFVGEADDDGYTPDFAKTIRRLQDAAHAARLRAAGLTLKGADGSEFVGEGAAPGGDDAEGAGGADEDMEAAERVYAAELAKEVRQGRKRAAADAEDASGEGEDDEASGEDEVEEDDSEEDEEESEEDEEEEGPASKKKKAAAPAPAKKGKAAAAADEEAAMADIMMTRKARKMYNNMKAKEAAKQERAEQLEAKKAKLAASGAAGPMGQAKQQHAQPGKGAAAGGKGGKAGAAAAGGKGSAGGAVKGQQAAPAKRPRR